VSDVVEYYIDRARSGDHEVAFHGLREFGSDSLPAMELAYHREDDPIMRSLLIKAIWRQRNSRVIMFLAGALRDPAPDDWKQALDGLVTLATPESMPVLQSAAREIDDSVRRAWIEEAIEQAADSLVPKSASR
jgi:hypothetical protein